MKEVKELRESCRSDKNVRTGKRRKPESHPEYNVPSEKKRQKHVEDSEEEADDQESNVLTVMGVSKQVRSSLRKWMAKQQNDRLGQLHEGEHYSLQIIPKGTPRAFLVSMKCLACGTSVMLHQIKSSVMVSNWYRHAKLCFKKQAGKKLIQLPIHGYIGEPQSESGSDIATESSSSSKVSDTESDTTTRVALINLHSKSCPILSNYKPIHCRIIFCYCRNTNEGTPMVCCDGCREWFHLSCINSKVEREKKWYCQNCNNKE